MTKKEAIERMIARINTASSVVGNGIDGKAYEDMHMAIRALKDVQEYQKFGTIEEVGAAVEKTNAMEVTDIHVDEYYCPNCGSENQCDQGVIGHKYCPNCGQKLKVKNNE